MRSLPAPAFRSAFLCSLLWAAALAMARAQSDVSPDNYTLRDGMPPVLREQVTIPGKGEAGEKLIISGKVLMPDGKTPARNVTLYLYHTNAKGRYPKRGNEKGIARWHGYLRGWLRTSERGEYRVTTIKPAAYPAANEPAHIHLRIEPPGKREYDYTFWFAGDPLITPELKRRVIDPHRLSTLNLIRGADGTWRARQNITLER